MNISREGADHLTIRINENLSHLSYTSPEAESCIFRVPYQLRMVNEDAYEPVMVAIGPYHHSRGKANLQEMEKHKLRYLQRLLKRQEETSVERYVKAIRELEEKARIYYEETISLDTDEFVEMMLLDGCFIVELFRKYAMGRLRDGDDPIFQSVQIRFGLRRDLILLENQLPFFILVELFNMTKVPSLEDNLILMALYFLLDIIPNKTLEPPFEIVIDDIKHLLGLVHDSWCLTFDVTPINVEDGVHNWQFINSATELEEAGVQFKMAKRRSLFDITFINGALEMPALSIEDNTESILRNLIAYEQRLPSGQPTCVSDYIAFMDSLINSPKDVQLLRRSGIIKNWVGDDAVVYTMINELCKFVVISSTSDFSYFKVFNDVNKHCRQRRNVWMATLRRNYFNSPWALVSFLAAVVLLLLTLTQTVFNILPRG